MIPPSGEPMTVSSIWRVLFYAWFASEIYVAIATRTRRSSGNIRDRGSMLILWLVITASITACEWIAAAAQPNLFGGGHWLKTAALILLVAGLTIRWFAILSLGKSFSANVAIQDTQKVHRSGLYRFVRHPSYLGLLIIFLAIGAHSRNWIGLAAVMLPTTAALLYRIRVEEAALCEAFGDEYLEYIRTTKRLVPGMY
jgi:protein-S-isoprenylcysteine O-methyltransferase Ste14